MGKNAPEKPAPITPYLYYEDVAGALTWLSRVSGFREREKETMRSPDGATILSGLEDTFYGDRRYAAADLEGHHWYFAVKIRPMAPEDWRPSQGDLKGHG